MNITDVRVRLVSNDDSKLKGIASITIDDCFVVHDIKILSGANDLFVAMPSRKTVDGEYRDIVHPINTATRQQISERIIKAFHELQLNKPTENN